MSWIAVAWGLVVSMLLLRLAGGLLLTQRLRRRASIIEATDILAAVSRLGIQLGIARPVRVLRSDELRAPATLGWLRPAIILPREFPASLPSDALDSLLAHELGHIHRHDSFAGTFQMIAEALLFHCPGARWLSALARQAREHCCDDIAVGATGDRDGYVAALGALAEFAHAAPALGAASPSLSGRIHRLIKGETMPRLSRPRILALVVGAALTVVAGVATAGGSLLHLLATEERTESTLPIGMIRSQPGAPVSITSRASATGLSDRYAFETIGVRNISEDEVTSLRFVAGVEVVGADPRLSLFESEAFPVALQPGEATEVKIDLLPISELRAIENRAAGHVQASIGVIEAGVSASPSDPWRIVPLRGASTLSDALHIRRPYVTRALVEAAPSGASRSRCRDDGGAVYSEGAILPVKDEPEPSLVYCTSGSWIARNP
jgi:beta-lactamase regulating signal transducer with metallopeptidase domain